MFAEPLAGWREVAVRETKTKVDWAIEMARLLEGRYASAERVIVVCDNLNTHTKGAFYEAFAPARARQLVRRIEFCYTPKHGSWLNIAENELSSLTRQCVAGRRFGDARDAASGDQGLVIRRQQHPARRRLANEDRRRPLQTHVGLPENQAVTKH